MSDENKGNENENGTEDKDNQNKADEGNSGANGDQNKNGDSGTKDNGTETLKVLNEIKDSLKKENPQATRAEMRAAIKEKTGFTDSQLDVVEGMQVAAIGANGKKVAELEAKVAWGEFKEDKGKLDPAIEKLMKEELKQYPVEHHGDKVLLNKIYLMSIGIQSEKIEKERKANPNNTVNVNGSAKIIERKIMNDNQGSNKSLNGDEGGGDDKTSLSDDEKVVARKMGVSEADYAKAKTTHFVGQLKGSAK